MDWALASSLLSCSHYFTVLALGFTNSVVNKTVEDSGLSTQPERSVRGGTSSRSCDQIRLIGQAYEDQSAATAI